MNGGKERMRKGEKGRKKWRKGGIELGRKRRE